MRDTNWSVDCPESSPALGSCDELMEAADRRRFSIFNFSENAAPGMDRLQAGDLVMVEGESERCLDSSCFEAVRFCFLGRFLDRCLGFGPTSRRTVSSFVVRTLGPQDALIARETRRITPRELRACSARDHEIVLLHGIIFIARRVTPPSLHLHYPSRRPRRPR